jgi:hypothetical protein
MFSLPRGFSRSRRRGALLLALPLVLLIAACAGAPASAPEMPAAGDAASGGDGRTGGEPQPGGGEDSDVLAALDGALIVRTGRLRLEVTDIGPAVDAASRLVGGMGGYVAASEEENSTSRHVATITYRIPSERWSDALAGLRAIGGRVISENTQSAEVTAEVVDLDARIANLRSAEAALQEIMTRAGSIEDVLKVQRELAGTRGQIEQLTAQRDSLRERAALGTLAVSFESPLVAVTAAQEGWDIGAEIDMAVAQLVRVGQAVASLTVWLVIVALPVLLPVALVVLLFVRLRRRAAWRPGAPAGPVGPSV